MFDTVKYKNHTIRIIQDELNMGNPRDWDNLGVMVCNHKRYNLGDEQVKNQDTFLLDIAGDCLSEMDGPADDWYEWAIYNNLIEDIREKLLNTFHIENIVLPLYLFDHSGITMNTFGFSCPWDSGQVGYIYAPKGKIREEYSWKRISKKRYEQIERLLKAEVSTYDDYLTGNVYGYEVRNGSDEVLDSCWGFYGYNHEKSGLLEMARDYIDYEEK